MNAIEIHDTSVRIMHATILNDVWALQRSPGLANLAARRGCALVLMHNQDGTEYAGDLIDEIKRALRAATVPWRLPGLIPHLPRGLVLSR